MSITYEEALSTLEAMFGAPWTRESLDLVLRHEKGHMENTCDRILAHGDRDPQILIDALRSGVDPNTAADEALARQLAAATGSNAAMSADASASNRSTKGSKVELPEGFLRIPGYTPQLSSLQDDEALARMLQDELFSEELRRNPDFAHLARGRPAAVRSMSRPAASQHTGNPAQGIQNAWNDFTSRFKQPQQNSAGGVPQSPNVVEKISALGDNAKRRLQMLAAQFNANNPDHRSPTAASAERRGLLDDHDDMELAARKDL